MSLSSNDPRWTQFRRLLLGTVVESLLEAKIAVEFASIQIAFDPASEFRVPRLDNYMRFKGSVTATVSRAPDPASTRALADHLRQVWPVLLSAVDVPVGDRLTSERNEIEVRWIEPNRLEVLFDLEAD